VFTVCIFDRVPTYALDGFILMWHLQIDGILYAFVAFLTLPAKTVCAGALMAKAVLCVDPKMV